jgi:hypothetical protein
MRPFTANLIRSEPRVRLLMENHSRRKNALKRPWDEKMTKFTLKPP